MDKKYINAVPIISWIDELMKSDEIGEEERSVLGAVATKLITDTNSADVRENWRGTWKRSTGEFKLCYCSECKTVGRPTRYCPNCGADMRDER